MKLVMVKRILETIKWMNVKYWNYTEKGVGNREREISISEQVSVYWYGKPIQSERQQKEGGEKTSHTIHTQQIHIINIKID